IRWLALVLGAFLPAPDARAQSVHRVAAWSVPPLKNGNPSLDGIAFSHDGKTLGVVASLESSQRWFITYDTATRKETLRFRLPAACRHFLYTPDGKTLLTRFDVERHQDAKEHLDRFVRLIDVRDAKTGKVRSTIRLPGWQGLSVHVT